MSNPQHEPTMEEILASIRKIISEDSAEATPEPEMKADPKLAPVHDDVLELTEEVHDTPAPEPVAAPVAAAPAVVEPEPVSAPPDDIEFRATEEEPPVAEPAPAPEPEPAPAPVMQAAPPAPPVAEPETKDHGLFSDKSRKALDDIFASIEPEEEEHEPAQAVSMPGIHGETVAGVFERAIKESFDPVLKNWLGTNKDDLIEGMKPVIREWLDQHFPAMLEEAVRNEVARVAKARPRR